MKILVIDVGGTHFKYRMKTAADVVKVPSGPKATPKDMLRGLSEVCKDWKYDHVSIGLPCPIVNGKPVADPVNLGKGWRTFDYAKAFPGKPVRLINDAAMQALGSYSGGRMLFLGLGTGLGSAMIAEGVVIPMELAHLPWKKGKTYEQMVGERALKKAGRSAWNKQVLKAVNDLRAALVCEDVVLGGGNAKLVTGLPEGVRLGDNANAFQGGIDLWADAAKLRARKRR